MSKKLSEVLSENEKVLVKFGASWCGPCRVMSKRIDKMVSDGFEEKTSTKTFSVDIEEQAGVGIDYKIKGIPTFVFFKNGVEQSRVSGIKSVSDFEKMVE